MKPSSGSDRLTSCTSRRTVVGGLLTCSLLASCATSTTPIAARPDAAIIQAHMRRETTNNGWISCIPVMANGQWVVKDWAWDHETAVAVEQGELLLMVEVKFLDAQASVGVQYAVVALHTQVEVGHVYRVNGRRQDEKVVVWLEDTRTGAAQAQQAEAVYRQTPPSPQTGYPVFLPRSK